MILISLNVIIISRNIEIQEINLTEEKRHKEGISFRLNLRWERSTGPSAITGPRIRTSCSIECCWKSSKRQAIVCSVRRLQHARITIFVGRRWTPCSQLRELTGTRWTNFKLKTCHSRSWQFERTSRLPRKFLFFSPFQLQNAAPSAYFVV